MTAAAGAESDAEIAAGDDAASPPIPITPLAKAELEAWLTGQPATVARWLGTSRFTAAAGEMCVLAAADGSPARVLLGRGDPPSMWDWAVLPAALPAGSYWIDAALAEDERERAALAWGLASYRFERYRSKKTTFPRLVPSEACNAGRIERVGAAISLARDLINTPAEDLGPSELAEVVRQVGTDHGAEVRVIRGEALLAENYPAVFAVGRASHRPPCLIDLRWGEPSAPKVTLVGKGVCFDTGGLDLKPSAAMKLMKKDMGGAAILLGLAQLVMAEALPVRLRLLIPAVENGIGGNALRPLDVIRTRRGLSVEIGNTDAEGRLILADALSEGASERPSLLIDCATLTGAARVALGSELPALFCNDDALAEDLLRHGRQQEDPFWRLPLWQPYRRHLDGKVADLNNAPDVPFAGAITAALFLAEFVDKGLPWLHLDVMAWNTESRPGRPEGGEASGLRALFALVCERFAAAAA